MNTSVLDSEGRLLASFGAGDPPSSPRNAVNARAAGRGGRTIAPAGATRSLLSSARRNAAAPGRGRRARQAVLAEIEAAATRARGGTRLTNRQIQEFRARLRGA